MNIMSHEIPYVGSLKRKIDARGDIVEVVYDENILRILGEKRRIALEILKGLRECGFEGYAYGSIARGDVSFDSDVDIVILSLVSLNILGACIERRWRIYRGEIVMATPTRTPALYLYLDPEDMVVVTKHLGRPSRAEYEFYLFGGLVGLEQIVSGKRVPGVNKRLRLIVPTNRGHIERPVIGYEAEVARILGISLETVIERVRVLKRRDQLGRTGVYFKIEFPGDKPVEEVIRDICKGSGAIRRVLAENSLC